MLFTERERTENYRLFGAQSIAARSEVVGQTVSHYRVLELGGQVSSDLRFPGIGRG